MDQFQLTVNRLLRGQAAALRFIFLNRRGKHKHGLWRTATTHPLVSAKHKHIDPMSNLREYIKNCTL